jgi:hypothetical protein
VDRAMPSWEENVNEAMIWRSWWVWIQQGNNAFSDYVAPVEESHLLVYSITNASRRTSEGLVWPKEGQWINKSWMILIWIVEMEEWSLNRDGVG